MDDNNNNDKTDGNLYTDDNGDDDYNDSNSQKDNDLKSNDIDDNDNDTLTPLATGAIIIYNYTYNNSKTTTVTLKSTIKGQTSPVINQACNRRLNEA